jgi:hypothetical protein
MGRLGWRLAWFLVYGAAVRQGKLSHGGHGGHGGSERVALVGARCRFTASGQWGGEILLVEAPSDARKNAWPVFHADPLIFLRRFEMGQSRHHLQNQVSHTTARNRKT